MDFVEPLQFEGIVNFRDMGGYEARDGRKVKRGLLFRSGELTNMTEKDKQLFQATGIRTILDYRDDNEAQFGKTPLFNNVDHIRIPAKKVDSVLQTASVADLLKGDFLKTLDENVFYKFYEELPFSNPAYKKLVRLLRNPNGAILHHCSAGKDRTGVGTAIIHMILDVPLESIFEDYLRTNEFMKDSLPPWIEIVRKLLPKDSPNLFMFTGVHESFLQATIDSIHKNYSSIDNYLEKEFDITKESRKQIQDFYLE